MSEKKAKDINKWDKGISLFFPETLMIKETWNPIKPGLLLAGHIKQNVVVSTTLMVISRQRTVSINSCKINYN